MRYSKTLLQVHAHWLTPVVTQGTTEVSSHGINVQKGVYFVVFLTVWETAVSQCYPCIYYTISSRQSKKADSITEKGEKALILCYVQCHKTCIIKNLLHIHTFCMFYSFWLGLKTTGLILEEKIQQNSFYQLWKSSQRSCVSYLGFLETVQSSPDWTEPPYASWNSSWCRWNNIRLLNPSLAVLPITWVL